MQLDPGCRERGDKKTYLLPGELYCAQNLVEEPRGDTFQVKYEKELTLASRQRGDRVWRGPLALREN